MHATSSFGFFVTLYIHGPAFEVLVAGLNHELWICYNRPPTFTNSIHNDEGCS